VIRVGTGFVIGEGRSVRVQICGCAMNEFRTDGHFASMVGKQGDEAMIGWYVKNQGREYKKLHSDHQLALF